MSLGKTVFLGVLGWGMLGSFAQADAITSSLGAGQWTFWSQGSKTEIESPTFAPPASTYTPPPTPPAQPPSPPPAAITYSAPPPPTSSSEGSPDAFLNFGNGYYAGSNMMTSGSIQPWYNSPAVTQAFGGTPTAAQQSDFANTVLQYVERTYQLSGIDLNLTLDPNANAPHTMSVVSGTSYPSNPNAIGITEVGGNGFSFIDKLNFGSSVDQLAWADAHNIAHELMHAFGVATHFDQTGTYLDSATANWDMLTSPDTTFSPEATAAILQGFSSRENGSGSLGSELLALAGHEHEHGSNAHCPFCEHGWTLSGITAAELLGGSTVPEPATLTLWFTGAGMAAALLHRRRALA